MHTEDRAHKLARYNDAVFAATNLEHKRLTIERELQDIKWFGYRFMSPLAATRLFYDTYRRLRVDYVREHKDLELASRLPVVPFEDYAKNPKDLASAWSARQAADTFCVPYDLYISFGMRFWSRRSGGGRSNTPQINQLGYAPQTEVAWRAEFQKHVNENLWLASRALGQVPQLHPLAFEATNEQVAARSFVLDLCSQSATSWLGAIEKWCHLYPVLTPECFAVVVPEDTLASAIETVALVPRDPVALPEPVTPSELWPSCLGAPNAMDPTSDTCAKCRFAATCEQLASMVKAEVRRSTGHDDPRRAALRANANARQRRHTAKNRAGGSPTTSASASIPAESSVPEVTLS